MINFNDFGEMSSGPDDFPDSSSLINLAIMGARRSFSRGGANLWGGPPKNL